MRTRALALILLALGTLALPVQTVNARVGDTVQTEYGPVKGAVVGKSVAFQGIPYAAPPVGPLRWKAPQPPATHSEVLDATQFGSPCSQPGETGGIFGNEDCLSLNIWTPSAATGPLPVMFFIHGGGNVTGTAGDALYVGQKLSETGQVVVVTINYRLGPLGYLAHPQLTAEDTEHQSSGNYGLLDQVFALQWVQRNIAGFGGDPTNVTIFGESAGGRNVLCLVASPLGAGLFKRAIVESGAPLLLGVPLHPVGGGVESAEEFGERLASALGAPEGAGALDVLRAATPAQLLDAIAPDESVFIRGNYAYGPNVDGYVLPQSISATITAGQHNDVDLIIGTNRNEMQTFIETIPLGTQQQYEAAVNSVFGELAPTVLAKYSASAFGSPHAAFEALGTDALFLRQARNASRLYAARHAKTYVYQFTQVLSFLPSYGAFHGLELPYLFGNFERFPVPPSKKDLKLSKRMQGYWTNFAKTGDPNGVKLPAWPVYTLEGDTSLLLTQKIKTQVGYRKEFCEFWDGLLGTQ